MALLIPQTLGAVRVKERLGEGGMAYVHRCEDPFRPERRLAVKLLKPEVHGDADLVRRFQREGELLKDLRHPNLVEVFGYGKSGSWPYLIMELLPGGSLKACLGESPAHLISRLAPVTGALHLAHEAGIVHRDLKPSNLLFAEDGTLKVTDFGVCMWEGDDATRLTRSAMVVGTVGYMAPEQHGDPRAVDRRADLYALGAILYEFCTGQPWALMMVPPAATRPGFPPRLAAIIMRCLQPAPAKRTATMAILGEELAEWLESAEAVGWGAEPLPGWNREAQEAPTQAAVRTRVLEDEAAEGRLGPYLDPLGAASVGQRRQAAEALRAAARAGDGPWLVLALKEVPEGARFGPCLALEQVGGEEAVEPLLALLEDPYCGREAAEAVAAIARRVGREDDVRRRLREPGLGAPGRWLARCRLGDGTWAEALARDWGTLSESHRIQALTAAKELPAGLRMALKGRLGYAPGSVGEALAAL
ncbi:MAG TPA: serine/threonine-protein kinase [Holophagaceae bacterium]|nr:serine/threonine-protein kinase [Holophagaceae bacterium]